VAGDDVDHTLDLAVVMRAGAHALIDGDVADPDVLGADGAAAAALGAQHAGRLRSRSIALIRFDDFDFSH
jgi:hypothetical protein